MLADLARQALYAILYYVLLVLVLRLAGKRLAGQTTTFDLVVLIQLAVVLQMTLLRQGVANAVVFVVTVLALHRLVARACARSPRLRKMLRGEPRSLVTQGVVLEDVLEETGHISAVRLETR